MQSQIGGQGSAQLNVAPPLLTEGDVFPVPLSSLKANTVLDFDLYRHQTVRGEERYTLYRHRARPYTPQITKKLLSYGVDVLYVPTASRTAYEAQCDPTDQKASARRDELMRVAEARKVYHEVVRVTTSLFEHGPAGISSDEIGSAIDGLVRFANECQGACGYLLSLKEGSEQLQRHSVNVAAMSVGLARSMEMRNDEILQNIGVGGLLHDIGMIRIPAQIREKQGRLTQNERLLLEQHPALGMKLLDKLKGIHWISRQIVHQHHEKCDRSGYPGGLARSETHLASRIVSLTEIYDALTHPRTYAEALQPKEALGLMVTEMRGELDQRLLRELIKFIGALRMPDSVPSESGA